MMITLMKNNYKTVISVVLSVATSLYQILADNAEILGVDNKYVMIASIVITAITIIVNGINNGSGETKSDRLLSYFNK